MVSKWKIGFIKGHISRNVETILGIEALVAFVLIVVSKKGAHIRPELEFMGVVWSEMKITCTIKNFKKGVVWFYLVIKSFEGTLVLQGPCRKSIDQEDTSGESIFPKTKG